MQARMNTATTHMQEGDPGTGRQASTPKKKRATTEVPVPKQKCKDPAGAEGERAPSQPAPAARKGPQAPGGTQVHTQVHKVQEV